MDASNNLTDLILVLVMVLLFPCMAFVAWLLDLRKRR
jgi:hypothetical protein